MPKTMQEANIENEQVDVKDVEEKEDDKAEVKDVEVDESNKDTETKEETKEGDKAEESTDETKEESTDNAEQVTELENKITELETQVAEYETLKAEHEETVNRVNKLEGALENVLGVALKEIPDNVKTLLPEGLDVIGKLEWVEKVKQSGLIENTRQVAGVEIGKPMNVETAKVDTTKMRAGDLLSLAFNTVRR